MQEYFQTAPIQINGLPVGIVCCGDASIALVPLAQFKAVIDVTDKYNAVYDTEGISIDDEEFEYGVRYRYKTMPTLLAWLKAQNMLMP